MPYATDNTISKAPLSGGVQISDEQYSDLLEGMMAGQVVAIVDGHAVLVPKESGDA